MSDLDDDTRLKLIGLKALATDYNNRLRQLADLANKLCGEKVGEYGSSSDFIFDNDFTLDDLVERLSKAETA